MGLLLVRIRYEFLLKEAYYYGYRKGTITTNYQRKRLKECWRCLCFTERQFQISSLGLLEAELDVSMGYDKNNKGEIETNNKRNSYSPKTNLCNTYLIIDTRIYFLFYNNPILFYYYNTPMRIVGGSI